MSLTDKEIAIVKDTANDTPQTEYVSSPLDPEAPIDWAILSETIRRLGPFRIRSASSPYTIELSIHDCTCDEENCAAEFAIVRRRNGLFSIQWMLSYDEVMAFDSLDHLRFSVLAGNMDDSCAERQIIEHDVQSILGRHHLDVKPMTCFCSECADAIGKEELPLHMLLSQMASNLSARLDLFDEVRRKLETLGAPEDALDEIGSYVSFGYDQGYQLGRQYSEYQVKRDIEGHALTGINFEEKQARRAHGAGTKSSGKRIERMTSLLTFMEQLAADSPAVLRIGSENLARMACEDASAADPALWSQGSGQVDEYLGLIRRGEAGKDLQARYFALFPPKLTPH